MTRLKNRLTKNRLIMKSR